MTWCVLSNGDHYHFYKASDPAKAEEKIFWKLSLTEDSPEEVAQFLRLISRECVGDNPLEQFWRQRALDRDVKAAL
ncbi:MAG: hypothetical protein IT452_07790 [Planctomycetia bacterium]|nr:hypothetical protein [Planctomycetia bacterium]